MQREEERQRDEKSLPTAHKHPLLPSVQQSMEGRSSDRLTLPFNFPTLFLPPILSNSWIQPQPPSSLTTPP
jgi:hypothetical protein